VTQNKAVLVLSLLGLELVEYMFDCHHSFHGCDPVINVKRTTPIDQISESFPSYSLFAITSGGC